MMPDRRTEGAVMSTKLSLLKLLSDHAGEYVSGEKIGKALGVSRTAVNKACAALRADGYIINSRTNKGYMLSEHGKLLTESGTSAFLDVPCAIRVYDIVTSTNEIAKSADLSAVTDADSGKDIPLVIVADTQTAGRGRLGRKFESPPGTGTYMSIVYHPKFDISKTLYVTMAAAVGMCRAIEKVTGQYVQIKWVNDLFLNRKKVCGILTEAQVDCETGKIDRLIIGIGVNCFPGSFPPEVQAIAGSLSDKPGSFSREILSAAMINEIIPLVTSPDPADFMKEYKERCFILGREIKIHPNYNDIGIRARAIDIADKGGLVVEYLEDGEDVVELSKKIGACSLPDSFREKKEGMRETIVTGEISISI